MKTIKSRFLFLLLAVMLCMAAFSLPAFAFTDEAAAAETPAPAEESGGDDLADFFSGFADLLTAFTPDGNLSLIDDFAFSSVDEDGTKASKQFITVQSKSGAYFFIIIDRVGDTENVYFLNMVDDADLFALIDDGEEAEAEPPVCTCDDHCYAGHVDTTCPVCAVNMAACAGKEPEPEPTPEPTAPVEPETPEKTNTGAVGVIVLLILAVVGGAAYYVLKVRGKAKPKTKGDTDLDDYDYGEDGDESEGEYAELERAGEPDGDEDDPDSGESEPYYPDSGGGWPDSGGGGPDA